MWGTRTPHLLLSILLLLLDAPAAVKARRTRAPPTAAPATAAPTNTDTLTGDGNDGASDDDSIVYTLIGIVAVLSVLGITCHVWFNWQRRKRKREARGDASSDSAAGGIRDGADGRALQPQDASDAEYTPTETTGEDTSDDGTDEKQARDAGQAPGAAAAGGVEGHAKPNPPDHNHDHTKQTEGRPAQRSKGGAAS